MMEQPSNKPQDTPFKQQRLRACQPLLTPKVVVLTYLALAILMIPLGFAMWATNNEVTEFQYRYDDALGCDPSVSDTCQIQIPNVPAISGTVFVYYKLVNFYQNHRRYVRSRNYDQLLGTPPTTLSSLSECAPLDVRNGTLPSERDNNSTWLLPCGLIASSQFSDRFLLSRMGANISLDRTNIAWKSDREALFKQPPDIPMYARIPRVPQQLFPGQTTNFTDEDFIVWMRVAGLPTFRKLYARIPGGLSEGPLTVSILNNFDVSSFKGEKWIVLTNLSWIGGKNDFLGIAFLVVGCLCLLLALLFFIINLIKPRKLGDASLLSWNQNNPGAEDDLTDTR